MNFAMAQIAPTYFRQFLDPLWLKIAIKESVAILKRVEFDSIAFTGMSGALIAPILAYKMRKTLLAVRKEDDHSTHSLNRVEENRDTRRYVIVDDFFSTGRTAGRIIAEVKRFCPEAVCVGGLAAKEVAAPDFDPRDENKMIAVIDEDGLIDRISNLAWKAE